MCRSMLALVAVSLLGADAPTAKPKIVEKETPAGTRFGLIGDKGAAPAPTLFIFAGDVRNSLTSLDYNKVGMIAGQHGFLCVALDVPGHGKDVRPGEPTNLAAWRARIEKGDDWLGELAKKTRDVLDYLVKEGYTDPERVAVAGTSRGGFIASHMAAAEPRFKAVIAFAPVTELLVVNEFKSTSKPEAMRALDLSHLAGKLAGRSYWLCIGNNDLRVGTDEAIAFTRKLVAAALAAKKHADVNVVIAPSLGHSIHKTAHDEAAAWLLERLKPAR